MVFCSLYTGTVMLSAKDLRYPHRQKDGTQVGFLTMILRVLVGGLIYGVTFGIGVIVSAFMVGMREDRRSIHDFVAGTYVTYALPDESIEKSE